MESLSVDDKQQYRDMSINQQKDWYISWLEQFRFESITAYGTKEDGGIFYIDEDKLTLDHIEQIRNYLTTMETKLRKKK
jgi:hypothetical protein